MASPLQRLATRHLCNCNKSVISTRVVSRHLTSSARNAQQWSPGVSSFESSELLKRRYQQAPEDVSKAKLEQQQLKKRMKYSAYGIVACAIGLAGTILLYPSNKSRTTHLDAPPPVVPGILETSKEVEQIETGTSTIPTFPKTIYLADNVAPADTSVIDKGEQEYQLIGLGVRYVFYIQVYVVGLYIAVPDIAKLQERLIRKVDPVATTLVPGEKSKLRDLLLDKDKGEEAWNDILKDGGIRMVWRIVPTRNTDFVHLRDGWVRGITSKTQLFNSKGDATFSDESFGVSLNEFKTVLGGGFRKKVPWGETILLTRDNEGVLNSWYEDKDGNKVNLGSVKDERISRLLWLIYLGGAKVSCEELRQNVVSGVMDYVERPVGTVATQVI